MSRSPEELLKLASDFDNVATRALVVTAKKKENKKLDPKAKVRNRGTVCVPAEQAKDKKDHFPINDEGQARNALARVQQLSSAPWYKGSLEGLKALVSRKVKAKYPGINVGGKDSKKSSMDEFSRLISKFGQGRYDNYGGEGVSPGQMTPEQLAQRPNDLANLRRQNLISQDQYQKAINLIAKQEGNQGTAWGRTDSQTPAQQGGGAAAKQLPPINSEVQKALNYLGFQGRDFKPLDPDGKRGPNTEFALLSFRQSSKWQALLNMQPDASWEELDGLVMQAKQMKEAGTDKQAPTDFTKGPTIGQPAPTKWEPGF